MTTYAIQLMAAFQWEEPMLKPLARTIPLPANHVVAAVAIGSKSGCTVIGSRRRLVFVFVATVAVCIDDLVTEFGARNMTPLAIGRGMRAYQRKATLLMNFSNFRTLDQPRCRCMAACTIVAHCLLVDVGMTFGTFCRSVCKNQRRMAFAALYQFVLTNQWEPRVVVIKRRRFYIIPCFRGMAIAAFQLKLLTMRRLHGKAAKGQQQGGHQYDGSMHRFIGVKSHKYATKLRNLSEL